MNDIINLIPEKYRATLLILLAVSPYITRAFHALATGGGLKGIFSAIWLGTNTPKNSPPPASPGGSTTSGTGTALLALAVAGLLFTGCASAYKATSAADITATAAMTAWGDYVAQYHPPVETELKVKAAFEKYQAAELLAIDSEAALLNVSATNSLAANFAAANEDAAQKALADLVSLLKRFGVKI